MSALSNRTIRRLIGLNTTRQIPTSATFTPTAGAANVANVVIKLNNGDGTTITGANTFDVYLSDAATGLGLTATTASGTVTAASGGGTVVGINTSKKAIRVQTLATGLFTLEITDTAKTAFYVVVVDPSTGAPLVSSPLVTANYG